ncbi:MAG: cysteine hydrolase [Chloroflexota bacterium]
MMQTTAPLSLAERIDPATTAVIVVDVQNDFCDSNSPLAKFGMDLSAAQRMVPRLLHLIDAARGAGTTIVWVKMIQTDYTFSPVAHEQRLRTRPNSQMICVEGSWGADFYRVENEPGEPVILKHRYSAFVDTDLELILRSRGIKSVILTGVATNVCVESTARDAYMRDYYVTFVDDCSAAYDADKHAATLRNMDDHFGVVTTSDAIMETWQHASALAR